MASSESYTPDERSKGKRYAKRTGYDKEAVHAVVSATPILHVSFNAPQTDDTSMPQFPTILPMLGIMGQHASDTEPHIYLHGSSTARLSRLTSGSADAGLPVCICATILDGYVLALTPFNHSCNYRSAVVFGYATRVTDEAEVLYAMEAITDSVTTGRWANSRTPPTKAEITATGVLKVRIETASVKARTGMPHDDRKDMKDDALRERVWVGTVPVVQVLGEPVASPDNLVGKVPSYLEKWVADVNQENQGSMEKSLDE